MHTNLVSYVHYVMALTEPNRNQVKRQIEPKGNYVHIMPDGRYVMGQEYS